MKAPKHLSWLGIVRLGLVQSALGAIVALATSTLNRVMVVEMALPAVVPAALVALHYGVQISRPRWGHGSDSGSKRTPWIVGGMGVLALGAVFATDATLMMKASPIGGLALAVLAFIMIGLGVGAAGTSLIALLASKVAPTRRPAAAAIAWILMIFGIVISAGVSGALLEPFSAQRLALVASGVALIAFVVTLLALWGMEGRAFSNALEAPALADAPEPAQPFQAVLKEIWAEDHARRFAIFVFVAMLAYSMQDLILEPFAGLVFGMTPGQSTSLSSVQHMGVLLGMILVGVFGARLSDGKSGFMRRWTVLGCAGSALALGALGVAGLIGPGFPLPPTVFALGFANGVFAVAAIGSMMGLASEGRSGREGVRVGVFGAAQAIAFALGGFLGALGVDLLRQVVSAPAFAFLIVFALEAGLFLLSARLAAGLDVSRAPRLAPAPVGLDLSKQGG